ncbi:hypothetical protein Ddye_000194 [Dipteronia dyeriana]|uniref:Reverse transcriptase n=1 Tax=Dipteronia dyeriana TaxID=168575 RepID=A0AAD9XLF7_9ROSI|nr:hypothetical protein Ddye_000194 [Dipteronia dyeriana]
MDRVLDGIQPGLSSCSIRCLDAMFTGDKASAMTITNKLRLALNDVISDTQCAFIPGQLISDNTIVGFKCLQGLKRRKRKKGSMTIKLNMAKAYDRVE